MNEIIINPLKAIWARLTQRPETDHKKLYDTVSAVLADVKANGDEAVKKYTLQFDKADVDDVKVTDKEISEAIINVSDELKNAIQLAKNNIEKFHAAQRNKELVVETMPGVVCSRKSVAIEKVGLYIPGGTAPLFSTLLMLGIPAMLAGCKEIIVCTPPDEKGKVNPVILYVADLLGLKNIFKVGGVQAIGAMAYGTETISKVNKIFGPGNQYVTAAKQLINTEGIAIDMPAGPSEVAVYADETCNPSFVAADLLSQAEHGADSQVILVAASTEIIDNVKDQIEVQLKKISRKNIAEQSLLNSRFIVIENADEAFKFLNEYAPEHLIIASDDADKLSGKVINAGSVFLGHYSPESAGDYASGTNHTLPTNGFANAYSGVSLDSFMKQITFQKINEKGLRGIGKAIEIMAGAEGLDAHKNAVSIRLKSIKNEV